MNTEDFEQQTSKLLVNVAHFSSKESIHEGLAGIFDFPGYYGMNWDAFDECFRDLMAKNPIQELTIKGLNILQEKLPREAKIMKDCLDQINREEKALKVTYKDISE